MWQWYYCIPETSSVVPADVFSGICLLLPKSKKVILGFYPLHYCKSYFRHDQEKSMLCLKGAHQFGGNCLWQRMTRGLETLNIFLNISLFCDWFPHFVANHFCCGTYYLFLIFQNCPQIQQVRDFCYLQTILMEGNSSSGPFSL